MSNSTTDIAMWCRSANQLSYENGASCEFTRSISDIIEVFSNKKQIHQIATELAEGLDELPEPERSDAERFLVEHHGFGFDVFIGTRNKKVMAILKRGKIRSPSEYRVLHEFANNSEAPDTLVAHAETLMLSFEDGHPDGLPADA